MAEKSKKISDRDFLKLMGAGFLSLIAAGCNLRPENFPEPTSVYTPTRQPIPTKLSFPETPQEQFKELLKPLHENAVKNRREFWSSGKEDLYKLSHYQALSEQKGERTKQLEPIINSNLIKIVVGGMDGKSDRSKDPSEMNCDVLFTFFIDKNTGKTTVVNWDRDTSFARGGEFQADGDIVSRIAHTDSTESQRSPFFVLDAQDPMENIVNNHTIATGFPPDYVILSDMDGYRNLMQIYSLIARNEDPEQTLTESRNRDDKSAGSRGPMILNLILDKATSIFEYDINDVNDVRFLLAKVSDYMNNSNSIWFAPSGNPLDLILPVLKEYNVSDNQLEVLLDYFNQNISLVQFTETPVPLIDDKKRGLKYFDDKALGKSVDDILQVEIPKNTSRLQIPLLYSRKALNGHLQMPFIPAVIADNKIVTIDWSLINKGVDYKSALVNDTELERLKNFWSLFRTIQDRYLKF